MPSSNLFTRGSSQMRASAIMPVDAATVSSVSTLLQVTVNQHPIGLLIQLPLVAGPPEFITCSLSDCDHQDHLCDQDATTISINIAAAAVAAALACLVVI